MALEAEKSASNKLKSKAIKEAKLLAKSEGIEIIKKTSPKKREIKTKPQNAESGYEKKVRMSDREYNSMRQSEGREYKKDIEMKLGRDDIVVQSKNILLDSSKILDEDTLLEEVAGQNIPEAKSIVSDKSDLMQNKIKEERIPPVIKEVEKVVYVKLKRRFDEDDENENENENENKNKDRSYDFDSLEDLDDRMDELYGELSDDSDSVNKNTEMNKINTEIASKASKGSSSKDPIKWKNGRLVNEKDKFFDKIRAENANSDSDEEEEEENDTEDEGEDIDESEENNQNIKTERKTIIKKSNTSSKKVTVELTGVTMKNMLEHLETTIGFDGLFTETNLRCFSVKPSINSALKVLRQLPLEWARKKIEYLYIQSKKRQ